MHTAFDRKDNATLLRSPHYASQVSGQVSWAQPGHPHLSHLWGAQVSSVLSCGLHQTHQDTCQCVDFTCEFQKPKNFAFSVLQR